MEVPQELLDRSATRRVAIAEHKTSAEVLEEQRVQSAADAIEELPENCRDCIFRPKNAEGNAGCMELNRLIGNLTTVSKYVGTNANVNDSFSITKGLANGLHRIRAEEPYKQTQYAPISAASEELNEDMEILGQVGNASHSTIQFLKDTFGAEGVGTTVETPSPEGIAVHVCIKALSDIVKSNSVTDAHEYANLPRMVTVASAITSAKEAGVIFS